MPFSNAIRTRETFAIREGDWSALEGRLRQIRYDGGTSYAALPDYSNSGEMLLCTDGRQNLEEVSPVFNGKLTIVNSSAAYDPASLNLMTILNDADFVQLAAREASPAPEAAHRVYGKIYGEFADMQGIRLYVRGRESEAVGPNASGEYSIGAKAGEVLLVTIDGRLSAERKLGDTPHINLWLEDSGEIRLDEVVVTQSAAPSGEPSSIAGGQRNDAAVGFAVQSITEEQIADISSNAADAAQGKFSGVRLGQNDDLSQAEIRSKTSILSNNYGLVVIDGVPMAKSNSSSYASGATVKGTGFIDPKNIASITVLKSLAATNRFGSLGSNGAILITTKTAAGARAGVKKDLALLTDNLYDGKIRVSNAVLTTPYLRDLKNGKSVAEAYERYLEQRETYESDPAYFIDVFEYFKTAKHELALRILTNILDKEDAGLPELKSLLYKAREIGETSLEYQTARHIADQFPGAIQSYLDLALAHRALGNYQVALNLLLGIRDGSAAPELDFAPLYKSVDRELYQLANTQQAQLDLGKLPSQYRNAIRYNARIICEWNLPRAAFELQFVNPQKRFFTWKHNPSENHNRLRQEQELGFGLEEFEIFGEGVQGDWILNARYLGNGTAATPGPVFLRCRIEYNYGKPNQRAEERVIRMHEIGSESEVAKIHIE